MDSFWRIILAAYTLAELEQLQGLPDRLERLHALAAPAGGMRAVDLERVQAYTSQR